MRAHTRSGFAGLSATPILPMGSVWGSPWLWVMSVQVSPPSVLFQSPESSPPELIPQLLRQASQMEAYMTSGFAGSSVMSTAPARGLL
mgnify:CR=1 FL=1